MAGAPGRSRLIDRRSIGDVTVIAAPFDAEPQDTDRPGWHALRQRLFGERRQRQAEDRLITILTEIHTRLAAATGGLVRGSGSAGALAPRQRAKALSALVEGVNALLRWHRDQLLAARATGEWDGDLPSPARAALARAQEECPLFEGAQASDEVECTDVVESVGQLRGAEGDRYFNQALQAVTAMLEVAYAQMAADAPTAPAASTLESSWQELLADVAALAVPLAPVADERGAAGPVPVVAAESLEEPGRGDEQGAEPSRERSEPGEEPGGLEQRAQEAAPEWPAAPVATAPWIGPIEPLPAAGEADNDDEVLAPSALRAAVAGKERFTRIELVELVA
jgi:hypothetical protein